MTLDIELISSVSLISSVNYKFERNTDLSLAKYMTW